ncbi:unnamed protein product [Lactuca virosa]|uniref:Uncharacterized protein n=1 Tax=Lactuca virosa TaxID=75947 RepID=A0AAU9M339_9ASTR|nr:unnamed protein product [Lactuca virosa]
MPPTQSDDAKWGRMTLTLIIFLDTDTSSVDAERKQHIPQGEPGNIESKDDVPLHKKTKAKVDSTSDSSSSEKKHKHIIVSKMVSIWGVSVEEAREFARQHNIQTAN